MDVGEYLAALGLEAGAMPRGNMRRVRTLQRAHVTGIPFANLVIVGDPYGPYAGEPAALAIDDIIRRLVDHGLGGLCYDHNALFAHALSALDVPHHIAGAVVCTDRPNARDRPDTHMTVIVDVDGGFVADVGFGDLIRRPIPLDGEPISTVEGAWRAVRDDTAEDEYTVQFQQGSEDGWQDRFRFDDRARQLSFFEDGFAYHYGAPGAPFADAPVASIATPAGKRTLSGEHLTIRENGEKTKRPIAPEAWHDLLQGTFGIALPDRAGAGPETNSLSRVLDNSGHERD